MKLSSVVVSPLPADLRRFESLPLISSGLHPTKSQVLAIGLLCLRPSLKMPKWTCLLFILLGLIFPLANSMRFDLQSGSTKCISDEVKSNAMTVGKYSVVNPNDGFPIPDSQKLTVRVSSPHGNTYHNADHVDSGTFAFTAAETGDYTTCFWAPENKPPATVAVEFDWRSGVSSRDWSKVAKKGQIDGMELELKKLYDTVISIHDEMFHLREREEEMQQLNRATNAKMATFSFLSLGVCLSVAGLQLWHLKTFFERKKLL